LSPAWLIGTGWLVMAVIMSWLWKHQQTTGKSGIVDVAWPLGVGGLAACFCAASLQGLPARRVLVAALALIWAVRLSWHIWTRLQNEVDDKRYLELREKWGPRFQSRLFVFYQFQAFGAVLFAIPMLIAARNPEPAGWLDAVAVLVWLVSLAGESLADFQLKRFQSDPANAGQVCRSGLWRYSRHPNYFFEWLHWWSYVCFAVAAPWGWLTVIGPLAMLYFIRFVTGIPPAEASSLKSRGAAYRHYQATTNAFFPWPPRAVAEAESR
jgi:steroid 5-alpha reductase family enzyme